MTLVENFTFLQDCILFDLIFLFLLFSVEPCKETEKSSEKGDDSPPTKTEDKENKPGTVYML